MVAIVVDGNQSGCVGCGVVVVVDGSCARWLCWLVDIVVVDDPAV